MRMSKQILFLTYHYTPTVFEFQDPPCRIQDKQENKLLDYLMVIGD